MASLPMHDGGPTEHPTEEDKRIRMPEYQGFNDPELDDFIRQIMSEFETAGVSILVIHGDSTFAQSYGLADVDRDIAMTPETLFFTGSTTKSFTASIAAHLVESPDYPEITWKTPLSRIIGDDFVLAAGTSAGAYATQHTTIEDALSHRSGMARHDTVRSNGDPSIRETVRSLRHLPMRDELRAGYYYTNIMYTAVVHAVETTLQQPFAELLTEQIFSPLNMTATSYSLAAAQEIAKRQSVPLARGYLWATAGYFHPVPLECTNPGCGASGVVSNVLDYGRWMRHLLIATNLNHALSTNAVKALRTPRILRTTDPYGPLGIETYGLGLNIGYYRQRPVFHHGGSAGGYMTTMLMIPCRPNPRPTSESESAAEAASTTNSNLAIVVMQNTDGPAHRIIAWHLADKVLQTPEHERRDLIRGARNSRAKKVEELKPQNILSRLFGGEVSAVDGVLPPALPLRSYEGVYRHAAYHDYRVSLTKPDRGERRGRDESREAAAEETEEEAEMSRTKEKLYFTSGSPVSYLDFAATLHHVSGEWWYQHRSVFVNCVLSDNARKLQFVIGPNGKVVGLKTLVEKTLEDDLTYFEKIP